MTGTTSCAIPVCCLFLLYSYCLEIQPMGFCLQLVHLFVSVSWSSWQLPLCSADKMQYKAILESEFCLCYTVCSPHKCWMEPDELHVSCLEPLTLGKTSLWYSVIWTALVLFKTPAFQLVFGLLPITQQLPCSASAWLLWKLANIYSIYSYPNHLHCSKEMGIAYFCAEMVRSIWPVPLKPS